MRLDRINAGTVGDLGAWLTVVVARVRLDMLRARRSRREDDPRCGVSLPEPIVTSDPKDGPKKRPSSPTRWAWRSSWCSTH